jgi:hypothetical protein
MIEVLGIERIEGNLNQQDIYNFLKGTASQNYKIQIFRDYLAQEDPDYLMAFSRDGLIRLFGDVFTRVSFLGRLVSEKDSEDTSAALMRALDGKMFMNYVSWHHLEGDMVHVLGIEVMYFRSIGSGTYLQATYVTINTGERIESDLAVVRELRQERAAQPEMPPYLAIDPSDGLRLSRIVEKIDYSAIPFEDAYTGPVLQVPCQQGPQLTTINLLVLLRSVKANKPAIMATATTPLSKNGEAITLDVAQRMLLSAEPQGAPEQKNPENEDLCWALSDFFMTRSSVPNLPDLELLVAKVMQGI